MAAEIYKVISMTFAGAAINGALTFRHDEDGEEISSLSGGEIRPTAIILANIRETISVSFRSLASGLRLGAAGNLVIVCKKMTGGVTLGDAVTLTATNAVIVKPGRGAGQGDDTAGDLLFGVPSADGITSGVVWS